MPIRIYMDGFPGRIQRGFNLNTQGEFLIDVIRTFYPNLFEGEKLNKKYDSLQIISEGVNLPFSTPLQFIFQNLLNTDGFVYFVLKLWVNKSMQWRWEFLKIYIHWKFQILILIFYLVVNFTLLFNIKLSLKV